MAIELTTKLPVTPASSDRVLGLRPSGLSPEDKSIVMSVETLLGVPIVSIALNTYTLIQADHNKILNFTAASAVSVIVPSGLTLPFVVGITQGGLGKVTLNPSGAALQEIDGLLSTEDQFAMLALIAISPDVLRVLGRTS